MANAPQTCPACAKINLDETLKCKHCGEFLLMPKPLPPVAWYFKTSILIMALLAVGPFALPLIWYHPRYTRKTKWISSAVILAASLLLGAAVIKAIISLIEYYRIAFAPS